MYEKRSILGDMEDGETAVCQVLYSSNWLEKVCYFRAPVLLNFLTTAKVAPHECVNRTDLL